MHADFIDKNPQYLAEPNMMEWISPNKGDSYNGCHYWYVSTSTRRVCQALITASAGPTLRSPRSAFGDLKRTGPTSSTSIKPAAFSTNGGETVRDPCNAFALVSVH